MFPIFSIVLYRPIGYGPVIKGLLSNVTAVSLKQVTSALTRQGSSCFVLTFDIDSSIRVDILNLSLTDRSANSVITDLLLLRHIPFRVNAPSLMSHVHAVPFLMWLAVRG